MFKDPAIPCGEDTSERQPMTLACLEQCQTPPPHTPPFCPPPLALAEFAMLKRECVDAQ